MAAPRHSTQILTATTGGPEENVGRDNRRKMKGEKGYSRPQDLIEALSPIEHLCAGAVGLLNFLTP